MISTYYSVTAGTFLFKRLQSGWTLQSLLSWGVWSHSAGVLLLLLLLVFISSVSCSHKLSLMSAPVPRQHHHQSSETTQSLSAAAGQRPRPPGRRPRTPVCGSGPQRSFCSHAELKEFWFLPERPTWSTGYCCFCFLCSVSSLPNSGQWFSGDTWFLWTESDWYESLKAKTRTVTLERSCRSRVSMFSAMVPAHWIINIWYWILLNMVEPTCLNRWNLFILSFDYFSSWRCLCCLQWNKLDLFLSLRPQPIPSSVTDHENMCDMIFVSQDVPFLGNVSLFLWRNDHVFLTHTWICLTVLTLR